MQQTGLRECTRIAAYLDAAVSCKCLEKRKVLRAHALAPHETCTQGTDREAFQDSADCTASAVS